MSELQVTSLDSTGQLSANVITSGQTTVNSTGVYLSNSGGVINSSAISVTNSTSGVTALAPTISAPGISIGGAFYTTLPNETVNTQIFTANGTWTKPSWATTGNELVIVHMWGGGGGGIYESSFGTRAGGGGGAFVFGYYKSSQLESTANVVVGTGGAGASGTTNVVASDGSASVFANGASVALTAYGGGGAKFIADVGYSGAGGGWLSAGNNGIGGSPLGGAVSNPGGTSTFGGGGGTITGPGSGGDSVYGGGGGARGNNKAGNSIFGGGGGSLQDANTGTSIYGGFGGSYTYAAQIPGGGGGANNTGNDGARGEVRVYTLRKIEIPEPYIPPTFDIAVKITSFTGTSTSHSFLPSTVYAAIVYCEYVENTADWINPTCTVNGSSASLQTFARFSSAYSDGTATFAIQNPTNGTITFGNPGLTVAGYIFEFDKIPINTSTVATEDFEQLGGNPTTPNIEVTNKSLVVWAAVLGENSGEYITGFTGNDFLAVPTTTATTYYATAAGYSLHYSAGTINKQWTFIGSSSTYTYMTGLRLDF
jgi:hypothetical protein